MRVEVVTSVVYEYTSDSVLGPPTHDWEIEVLAPRAWIDEQVDQFQLAGPNESWSWGNGDFPELWGGTRDWYAPLPLESYEGFVLILTSIPYIHMLVQKDAESDGRFRVYVSKH